MLAPFIDQNIGEDQRKKKRSLPTNHQVFSLKTKKTNKWCHPGRAAPPPATPLFTLLSFAHSNHRRSQDF